MPDRVGVRELRQNLSVYLRRVKEGETLEVTERNRTVALLAPLRAGDGALGRLAAQGRIARRATRPISSLSAAQPAAGSARALDEQRSERL